MRGLIDPVATVEAAPSLHRIIRQKTIANIKAGRSRNYIPPALSQYESPERPMLKSKWLQIHSPA